MDGDQDKEAAAPQPTGNEGPLKRPWGYSKPLQDALRMWKAERDANPDIGPFHLWAEQKFLQGKEAAGEEERVEADGKPFTERYTLGQIRRFVAQERKQWERTQRDEQRREKEIRQAGERVERTVTQWVKGLPEFRVSGDDRIQAVSQELRNLIAELPGVLGRKTFEEVVRRMSVSNSPTDDNSPSRPANGP
jgi:hypothetical protein